MQADKSRVKKATYKHFPTCSTLSNMVGPIVMPPFHQVWRLPWRIKKELYGKALIMVGGQVQDADDIEEPEERKVKRTPETVEPVFYHGYPPIVFQDILKSLQVRYCIDLTPISWALSTLALLSPPSTQSSWQQGSNTKYCKPWQTKQTRCIAPDLLEL